MEKPINASREDLLGSAEMEDLEKIKTTNAAPSNDYGSTSNVPPNYESPPKNEPPIYKHVIYEMRKLKENSSGKVDFVRQFFNMIFSSIIWTIFLLFTLGVPLSMIIIGTKYINDCPLEAHIPVMLIVSGSLLVISNLMIVLDRLKRISDPVKPTGVTVIGSVTTLLNFLAFGWFIAGCVWVFGSNKPSSDPKEKSAFCHPILYNFAFWLLNVGFMCMGGIIILGIIGLCCNLLL
ncbi:uncharacterized protein LOC143247711 [Tachypleus tridentatus]|uniref:uncharacterized protein LOC143247711 n=1 Tax=Tachypleus tridentatus TaxID=6853 RepID=UPI003FD57601